MPGVLVDELALPIDHVTASLIDSPPPPSDCIPAAHLLHSPLPPSFSQLDHHLTRSFSCNDFRDPELSHMLSLPSPLPFHGIPSFHDASGESLQVLAPSLGLPAAFSGYDAQEFQLEPEMIEEEMAPLPIRPDAGVMLLRRFLPSNLEDEESMAAIDAYASDEFRMFEFKVRRCMRGRSHDWTECPFSHTGEKARRRDPRRFHYSGTACPDFRKGNCKRGDSCEYAHGVFECWLHPSRYRTQPCKDGRNCKRRVCFFAHSPEQLRLSQAGGLPAASKPSFMQKFPAACDSYDGSPLRLMLAEQGSFHGCNSNFLAELQGQVVSAPPSPSRSTSADPCRLRGFTFHKDASTPAHRRHLDRLNSLPTISIPASDPRSSSFSSPTSPAGGVHDPRHMSDLIASLKQLEVGGSRPVWQAGKAANGVGARYLLGPSPLGANSHSVPSTPTKIWKNGESHWQFNGGEIQPQMERVESGRDLRAKVFENLVAKNHNESNDPDLGWVTELVTEESEDFRES